VLFRTLIWLRHIKRISKITKDEKPSDLMEEYEQASSTISTILKQTENIIADCLVIPSYDCKNIHKLGFKKETKLT